MNKQLSDCCNAEVLSVSGYPKDEGTHYWQCSECGRPCDIKETKKQLDHEELWDWCCTEVMRLDNGEDVWNQINKVHQFSKHSSYTQGVNETIEKVKEMVDKCVVEFHGPVDVTGIIDEKSFRQQLETLKGEK